MDASHVGRKREDAGRRDDGGGGLIKEMRFPNGGFSRLSGHFSMPGPLSPVTCQFDFPIGPIARYARSPPIPPGPFFKERKPPWPGVWAFFTPEMAPHVNRCPAASSQRFRCRSKAALGRRILGSLHSPCRGDAHMGLQPTRPQLDRTPLSQTSNDHRLFI